jgi:diaminohydroxyphosphoribosylaminopyrimidine deaminase/5-amino-6-(5-phosphoribosylamino)uracil reductase
LVFTGPQAPASKRTALEKLGVQVLPVPLARGRVQLPKILTLLAEREISSVLVEGGGQVHTDFLEKRLADKVLVTVSPKLVGGTRAPSFFQGRGIRHLQDAWELRKTREFRIQDDVLIEGYF